MAAVKNAVIREAEAIKAGTKFIVRDRAQQQMWGAHTQKWFALLRPKPGRDAHPDREGVGVPRSEEERSEGAVRSFI